MARSQWSFRTAVDMSAALAARKVSAVELAEDAIGRIERHDAKINAICVRDFDRALAAARNADAELARGAARPLLGIPLTVKESYNVAGLPTTWGIPAQKDFVPPEDALSITRVKDAGGVILGKTNVPMGLGDWQSYNEIYGTTSNPFDLGRTPGGSSGGSSAALAAGYGPLSLGSDIGGSLRVPAFHCGVYAHKPTFALVPGRGHTPPPFQPLPVDRDLAVIGPMARSAADLALLLDVMAGPDPLEAGKGYRLALPPARHAGLKDFRVLVIDSDPVMPTDEVVRGSIHKLAAGLEKAGVKIDRNSPLLPDFAETSRLYMRMLMSFLAASYPQDVYAAARTAAAALPLDEKSLGAERLRGIAQSHRDWLMDDVARARLRAQWRELFKTYDAVICPIMPTPAYPHDHSDDQEKRRIRIDGKDLVYPDMLSWPGIATLPGLPSTAIPTGFSPDGLPVGVQIVGAWLEDRTPLRLAELIEREFGGFVPPPMFDDWPPAPVIPGREANPESRADHLWIPGSHASRAPRNDEERKPMSNDLDELTALNRDYIASVQNCDVERFDEILAADFWCSNPDKTLIDRAAFLKQTAVPVTIRNLTAHDVKIRILGDFAIIHAATSYTTADGAQAHGRYTDCWAKQDGKWLAVSAHVSR